MLKPGTRVRGKDKYGEILEGYISDINITYNVIWDTDTNFKPKQYKAQIYGTDKTVDTDYEEFDYTEDHFEIVGD